MKITEVRSRADLREHLKGCGEQEQRVFAKQLASETEFQCWQARLIAQELGALAYKLKSVLSERDYREAQHCGLTLTAFASRVDRIGESLADTFRREHPQQRLVFAAPAAE